MELAMTITCPGEEKLADYLEGRLTEGARLEMEEHLSDCDVCLEALVVTRSLVRAEGQVGLDSVPARVTESAVDLLTDQNLLPQHSWIEKLKQSVDALGSRISDSLGLRPWQRWDYGTVRSSQRVKLVDNLVSLKVPFKDIESEIEMEKTGPGVATIRVKLQTVRKTRKALRVTLKTNGREIASYLLDDNSVIFEAIPFGHYSISLAEDGVGLGTYHFEIKENHNG